MEDPLIARAEAVDRDLLWVPEPGDETYTRPSPEYTLFKLTQGFHGPTHLDVRVEHGERPHVVLLVMESVRGRDVGMLGGRYPVTPQFDRLSAQGVLFTSFYAASVQTTRALVATLFGIMPRFTADAVQADSPPSV